MDSFSKNIAAIRQDYSLSSLNEQETGDDPVLFFAKWFKEAAHADCIEVNAMTLATVDAQARPHARIVLLKGLENGQFVFYTNYNSNKGMELAANHHAALLFFWPELQRQVRVAGTINKVSPELSDEYFYSRPLSSQIGAMASAQSSKISSREVLEEKVIELSQGGPIARPEHWGGYALTPTAVEFWQGRSSRLHDRILFEKEDLLWQKSRLAP
ncbi:MAG: pyridoxamine 5'-phosphate oxidase [Sphingobacteriales bacterium]|nr:MAG: pyridoxamine 5'-phosphate oxidase [Sphingobacteriales bacterium]